MAAAHAPARFASIEKHSGETPLQALERFRHEAGISARTPLSYAGRLDPLASGALLILIGDACKAQHRYRGLDKAYEFEVLLGCATDTGDVLGYPEHTPTPAPALRTVRRVAASLIGTHTVPYPPFSSKIVEGKPLVVWALEGALNEITIPEHTVRIYTLSVAGTYTLSSAELRERVTAQLASLTRQHEHKHAPALGNDFRRTEVAARWASLLEGTVPGARFTVLRCRAACTSGTYIRTLAPMLARALGACGLALSIRRTTIGTYQPLIPAALAQHPAGAVLPHGFWLRRYATAL